jgi:hypothetical protein
LSHLSDEWQSRCPVIFSFENAKMTEGLDWYLPDLQYITGRSPGTAVKAALAFDLMNFITERN